jgi:predicted Zn-dependent protease
VRRVLCATACVVVWWAGVSTQTPVACEERHRRIGIAGEVLLRHALDLAPQTAAVAPPVETFFREWHVITISHCARWQLDCADTLLASAKERLPGSADVLVIEASIEESRQHTANAMTLLRRAVRAEPNNVAAELRLGRLLLAQRQPLEAETVLNRALTLARAAHHDASRSFALESLAEIDRRAGRPTDARAAEAATIKSLSNPVFAGMTPVDVYRFGVFYEQPRRIAALRELLRPQGSR